MRYGASRPVPSRGPSIRNGLSGSASTLLWLSAGYTLAFAVFLITGALAGTATIPSSSVMASAADPGAAVTGVRSDRTRRHRITFP
jgi:hypothetical protein